MANVVSPARGMRDILPQEQVKREYVLNIIKDVYKSFGFEQIQTPAVELISRLKSKQGGDNESMLFEILKRGLDCRTAVFPGDASDLGLRYDLTLPLSRFFASNKSKLPSVFRVLQVGSVWRAERPQKGRYRQFTQCDIDILGEESVLAEIELIVATLTVFKKLGMGEKITLHVNDRRVLQDLLASFGVDESDYSQMLIILDKWDKIRKDGVAREIVEKNLMSACDCASLVDTVDRVRSSSDVCASDAFVSNGVSVGLYDLPTIVSTVKSLVPDVKIEFDVSLVRGMGYYTGPIFEVTHDDFSSSVAGGGRYNKMIGKWLGKDVPACGFSIGFERIVDFVSLPDGGGNRCAVLYDGAMSYEDMFRLRREIFEDGKVAVFVKAPRKLNSNFFDRLVSEGFAMVVDIRNVSGGVFSGGIDYKLLRVVE